MNEKIDELILSRQENNILLAFQIIKTFGNISVSHLNMCLAAISHFSEGKIVREAEELLSEFCDISIWKKNRSYQTYRVNAEKEIRVSAKLPFYDYLYFFIWQSIFKEKERRNGRSFLRIQLNEFKILPSEVNYLGNLRFLEITLLKEGIDLAAAFANFSLLNDIEHLAIRSYKLLESDIYFFTKFNIQEISLYNIHLINADNLQGLFQKTSSLIWKSAELTQVDLRPFPSLMNLNLQGNLSTEIKIGTCKNTLKSVSISGHPHYRRERPVFFPAFLGTLNKLESFRIENQNIKRVPEQIGRLHNLKNITIINSRLKEFPVYLGNLTELTNLKLDKNLIQEIPDISNLFRKLTIFDLSRNLLTQFPASLGSLPALKALSLECNRIESFEFSKSSFRRLNSLQLSNNRIKTLSEFMKDRIGLQYLHLNANQIETINLSCLIMFRRIRRVYLRNNKISTLPNIRNINMEEIFCNHPTIKEEGIEKSSLKIR